MLIAPIFHNNYRSPKTSSTQDKINENSSSPCASISSKASDAPSLKKYNIFKTAFNKSINFLSKITNSSSGSPSTSSTSTGSKCRESEDGGHSSENSNGTPSDCSSPDSLMTELIFFKPISREPRTPSSTKPAVIRVPSIRSNASSTDFRISSPCPSPFFIPVTPQRRSAFSFVAIDEREEENEMQTVKRPRVVKPKTSAKRKIIELSPEKPKNLPKKGKVEIIDKPKTECRKTRSMDKKSADEVSKVVTAPPIKKPQEVKKSPKRAAKNDVEVVLGSTRRVLRSHSFKN